MPFIQQCGGINKFLVEMNCEFPILYPDYVWEPIETFFNKLASCGFEDAERFCKVVYHRFYNRPKDTAFGDLSIVTTISCENVNDHDRISYILDTNMRKIHLEIRFPSGSCLNFTVRRDCDQDGDLVFSIQYDFHGKFISRNLEEHLLSMNMVFTSFPDNKATGTRYFYNQKPQAPEVYVNIFTFDERDALINNEVERIPLQNQWKEQLKERLQIPNQPYAISTSQNFRIYPSRTITPIDEFIDRKIE